MSIPRSVLPLLAVAALACASASERVYLAASDATVTSLIEEGRGDEPQHLILVYNRSTVPVLVTSVTLRQCENVRQQCEPRTVDIKVPPGQRRIVMRVDPKSSLQGFGFRYTFSWTTAE